MKYFRLTAEEILWKYSWANLVMFLATVPEIDTDTDDDTETKVTSTQELTAEILKKHTNLKF